MTFGSKESILQIFILGKIFYHTVSISKNVFYMDDPQTNKSVKNICSVRPLVGSICSLELYWIIIYIIIIYYIHGQNLNWSCKAVLVHIQLFCSLEFNGVL